MNQTDRRNPQRMEQQHSLNASIGDAPQDLVPPRPRLEWMLCLAEELRRIGREDWLLKPQMDAAARALEIHVNGGDPRMVVTLGQAAERVVRRIRGE